MCVFRSSSVDTPPVETIVSSVTLDERVNVKKTEVDVNEEKMEESHSPAITQPPHTSPDLTFASEVTNQKMEHGRSTFIINQYRLKYLIHTGTAEDRFTGGPESGC